MDFFCQARTKTTNTYECALDLSQREPPKTGPHENNVKVDKQVQMMVKQ